MTIFNSCCFALSSSGSCFSSYHMCLQHMPRLLHLQLFPHPPHFPFPHRPLSSACCAEVLAALHLPLLVPPAAAQLSLTRYQSIPEKGAMGISSWLQSKGLQYVPPPPSHPTPPFTFPCFLRLHLHPQNSVELRYLKVIKTPKGTRLAQR